MKLIDILTVYDENENLTIVDKNDDWLATYDGKNSIDDSLNEYEVIKIYPLSTDTTVVMVDKITPTYRDKNNGNEYTRNELLTMWNALDEDIKEDYRKNEINNFEDWLEIATDFDGHLEII